MHNSLPRLYCFGICKFALRQQVFVFIHYSMTEPTTIQILGAALFALAVIHTFSTKYFEDLSHRHPRHAGLLHLLGEVEVVFGFWAMVLMGLMFAMVGLRPRLCLC